MDVNCCIKAVIEFKGIKDYYKGSINNFIQGCSLNEVLIGYFPIIRNLAERNVGKAVSELLDRRPKDIYKATTKSRNKLDKLFDEKLTEFEEDWKPKEFKKM